MKTLADEVCYDARIVIWIQMFSGGQQKQGAAIPVRLGPYWSWLFNLEGLLRCQGLAEDLAKSVFEHCNHIERSKEDLSGK